MCDQPKSLKFQSLEKIPVKILCFIEELKC